MTWAHDDLAADLAQHLLSPRVMIWTDMQLGPSGSPRPDVWVLDKSFARTRAITYEVKVSVADFRADVTAGKWQAYLGFSCGVYFAVPAGLISKTDVPKGCGLMVRGDVGWRTMRAPTLQPVDIDWVVARKLLIDGRDREVRPTPRKERTPWGAMEKISRRWGKETAEALADLAAARANVETLSERAAEQLKAIEERSNNVREEVDRLTGIWLDEFCMVLKIPRGSHSEIAWRLGQLRTAVEGSRCNRSNLHQAEAALESELARVRQIRAMLEPAAEVAS